MTGRKLTTLQSSYDAELGLEQECQLSCHQLSDAIAKLKAAAVTPSQRAVVLRYQEIARDLTSDFNTCVQRKRQLAERRELLSGNPSPDSDNCGLDSLLRERSHISNSTNVASSTIAQAESIQQDLQYQGRSLRNSNSVMGRIGDTIPGMNRLVDSILQRRLRDDQIVSIVIAILVVFTLWYIFG